jgi:hypothetical protein
MLGVHWYWELRMFHRVAPFWSGSFNHAGTGCIALRGIPLESMVQCQLAAGSVVAFVHNALVTASGRKLQQHLLVL